MGQQNEIGFAGIGELMAECRKRQTGIQLRIENREVRFKSAARQKVDGFKCIALCPPKGDGSRTAVTGDESQRSGALLDWRPGFV